MSKSEKKVAAKTTKKKVAKRATKPKQKEEAPKEAPAEKAETAPRAAVRVGPAPDARVLSRYGESMHERDARGFSFGELASAGVHVSAARQLNLHIDLRRRSVLTQNVEKLKGWYTPEPKRTRAEKPARERPKARAAKK